LRRSRIRDRDAPAGILGRPLPRKTARALPDANPGRAPLRDPGGSARPDRGRPRENARLVRRATRGRRTGGLLLSARPRTDRARGRFVTFEGIEGSGKTTQLAKLAEWLRRRGVACTVTREPGGTRAGDVIRSLFLGPAGEGLDAWSELFLV